MGSNEILRLNDCFLSEVVLMDKREFRVEIWAIKLPCKVTSIRQKKTLESTRNGWCHDGKINSSAFWLAPSLLSTNRYSPVQDPFCLQKSALFSPGTQTWQNNSPIGRVQCKDAQEGASVILRSQTARKTDGWSLSAGKETPVPHKASVWPKETKCTETK